MQYQAEELRAVGDGAALRGAEQSKATPGSPVQGPTRQGCAAPGDAKQRKATQQRPGAGPGRAG